MKKNVALICQDASRFFHDACFSLSANNFVYMSDIMNIEITMNGICYTYLDARRYSGFNYDHVLKAGYQSDPAIKAHEGLIKAHTCSANSIDDHKILALPEVGLLGNIGMFTGYNLGSWLTYGDANEAWGYTTTDMTKKKCECGVSITMGKDDSPEYHSDYCPIYKPKETK